LSSTVMRGPPVFVAFQESDVIRLPFSGREAGVTDRRFDLVNAATVIVLQRIQPKRIKHLHFIFALQINTAVAAILPGRLRM
jgi:hypothetical protein